jgi:hypothetical protein
VEGVSTTQAFPEVPVRLNLVYNPLLSLDLCPGLFPAISEQPKMILGTSLGTARWVDDSRR